MTDPEQIRAALDLDPYWEVRYIGPSDTVREIGAEYHQNDVPTRLAPLPSGTGSASTDAHPTASDGGEATAHVLLVDSLCVSPGATDDIHHPRADTTHE